ncbi:MAG: hydroxyphenylacetyl-CoA thioesterase PaaI [Gammaproteobacteria bacterium]|nr:hydroxyphenylacetyl-CoA thioesterase PaaI [Gammaproteobacteria bacterium]
MDELQRAQRCAEKMYANDKASQKLGIEIEIPEPATAVATMRVHNDMLNGFDVCHGGLVFTLADTAFAFACNAYDRLTLAAAANIDFLRPAVRGDELVATATEDYRGQKTGFYTIRVRNQRDELVAVFRGRSVSKTESVLDSD